MITQGMSLFPDKKDCHVIDMARRVKAQRVVNFVQPFLDDVTDLRFISKLAWVFVEKCKLVLYVRRHGFLLIDKAEDGTHSHILF